MNTLKPKILTAGFAGVMVLVASTLPAQDIAGRGYLSLDVGLALQQDITLQRAGDSRRLSFDPGARLDLSGGLHLSESWRAELELGFIFNSVSAIDGESAGSSAEYFQVPIMANGIYTLPLHGPIRVYVGAGLGGVASMFWNNLFDADDSFTFGYQAIVGAKYALNDSLDLGLSYKLLGTLEHDLGPATADGTFSHSILAAITFKF